MRKSVILVILLIFTILSVFPSVAFTFSNRRVILDSGGLKYIFPDNIFSYQGKYISYGRLDKNTFINTLENPYRRRISHTLSSKHSKVRGIRGFEVKYKGLSAVMSLDGRALIGASYDGKHLDFAALYYSEQREKDDAVFDYRRKLGKDVFSFGLGFEFEKMLEGGAILSYSPHLGFAYFFHSRFFWGPLRLGIKGGTTLLSEDDGKLEFRLDYVEDGFSFSYGIKYGDDPVFTGSFREYESLYRVRIGLYEDLCFETRWDFEFDKEGERKKSGRFSLVYKDVKVGLDTSLVPNVRVRDGDLEIGTGKRGVYAKVFLMDGNFSIKLRKEELVLEFRVEFA